MPSPTVETSPEDLVYEHAAANAEAISRFTGDPSQAAVYILPFFAFALLAYLAHRRSGGGDGFFGFTFPRRLYLHRSSFVDVQVFVANRLLIPTIAAIGASATALFASKVAYGLGALWPGWSGVLSPDGWIVAAGFTVALALTYDFATYVSHRLHHQSPRLWSIHKVHHSAEVLTPITAFRHHPAYEVFSEILDVAVAGPFLGIAFFVLAGPTDALTILGVHAVFVAFQLMGAGLRHSHMWLAFPRWLSHLVISPAQHQIHHSADPRHYDRNFGEVFAIWDWMFGTLYVPTEREDLTFGLGEPQSHTNLWRAWTVPVREAIWPPDPLGEIAPTGERPCET